MFNIRQKIGDNFRRDIPEAQGFIYPDDSQRISKKDAAKAAGYIGAAAGEGFLRAGIPIPVRALIGEWGKTGLDRIKAVANRPDATPSMHQAYLNDKYGATGWDVYRDRNNQEGRNPGYYYNEQDFGNGNYFVQREKDRFAGEVLSDEFLEDIKAHGIEQDMLEEYVELKKQRELIDAIHGKTEAAAFLDPNNQSRTLEQQIGRDLIMRGVVPDVLPPDRIAGKNVKKVQQSGIDGEFKPDSEIRRDAGGRMAGDMLTTNRGDIYTEVLSPESIENIFAKYKENLRANKEEYDRLVNDRSPKGRYEAVYAANQQRLRWAPNIEKPFVEPTREDFNLAASEYYGQQALRMRGATPVPDGGRSGISQRRNSLVDPLGLQKTTVGTDRLVEASPGITDVPNQYKGDFRYIDAQGNLRVGDMQMRPTNDNTVRFNLAKASKFRPGDEEMLEKALVEAVGKHDDASLSSALERLANEGFLGELSNEAGNGRFRPGKLTADLFDDVWVDGQDSISSLVVGMTTPEKLSSTYGMLPDKIKQYSGNRFRDGFGKATDKSGKLPGKLKISSNGRIDLDTPGGAKSSLTPEQNRILSEPYAFN